MKVDPDRRSLSTYFIPTDKLQSTFVTIPKTGYRTISLISRLLEVFPQVIMSRTNKIDEDMKDMKCGSVTILVQYKHCWASVSWDKDDPLTFAFNVLCSY